ncbi:MAG: hypothetical protein IBJ02_08700 [Brevundimonas sp.]|nr:hypothetical protein [Brevundimonas sp.]
MRLIALAAASALALSACSQGTEPSPAPTEPEAPVELGGVNLNEPVRLLGTEPFWGITLSGNELVYSGVDRPEQRAHLPAPTLQGTVATYETTTANGSPISIMLAATECSDGMSDRTYPLTARVKIGAEELSGCAASLAAIMSTGESGPVQAQAQPAA